MKKIIYVILTLVFTLTLSSCQSNEDKVKKLVYEKLKPAIYDIDLYNIEVKQSEDNMYKYYVYFTSTNGDCSCMEVSYLESSNNIIIGDNCNCHE